jgi:hypothetical protein
MKMVIIIIRCIYKIYLFTENAIETNENNEHASDKGSDSEVECEEEKVAQIKYTHQRELSREESIQISAQFYRDMNARRSVRDISDQPVDRQIIENILRTAGVF